MNVRFQFRVPNSASRTRFNSPLGLFPGACYMSDPMIVRHQPVLAAEVLQLLSPATGETWVDCTTGGGGHTRLIASRVGATGRVLALDRDPGMLELARPRLAGLPVTLIPASF